MARLTTNDLRAIIDSLPAIYAAGQVSDFLAGTASVLRELLDADLVACAEVDLRRSGDPAIIDIPDSRPRRAPAPRSGYLQEDSASASKACRADHGAPLLGDELCDRGARRLPPVEGVDGAAGSACRTVLAVPLDETRLLSLVLKRSARAFGERERLILELLRPHLGRGFAIASAASRPKQPEGIRRRAAQSELGGFPEAWPPSGEAGDLTLAGLTRREAEVLRLLAQGNSNDQIATALVVTPWTVQKHLAHIYRKLDVRSRTAAVARAFRFPRSKPS